MTLPLSLVFVHFVADFVFQNDWMALNKSRRMLPLLAHTTVYAAFFLPFGWQFAAVTWLAHTVQDFITSRGARRLYEAKENHWFFVLIGFDQVLHYVQLAFAYHWLVK